MSISGLNRRNFFGLSLGAGLAASTTAQAQGIDQATLASMRGSIDASEFGVEPGALDRKSDTFTRMLQASSDRDQPIFLPAGVYVVSNVVLPRAVRLSGVPGATRIVYSGDGFMLLGQETELFDVTGIAFDGANRFIGDTAQGLIDLRGAMQVSVRDCQFSGAAKNAIALERCAGKLTGNTISGADDAAIYAVESAGLEITGNQISDCGNGGVLVHRWQPADDKTLIANNRISRIAARNGGTGQNGNGINAFRAKGVVISNNIVSDCAFSAIRGNSASNMQVVGNNCTNSGETAIYAEFGFEGAVISANVVDGCANGISIVNFDNGGRLGVCQGNLVRNMRRDGPYEFTDPGFGTGIAVEADCAITGNVVENAPLYGVNIGWGKFMRNVTATGNVVRKAKTGIGVSVVKGTGTALISDNVLENCPSGGVVGHEWAKPVTGDLAKEQSGYSNVVAERNRVA